MLENRNILIKGCGCFEQNCSFFWPCGFLFFRCVLFFSRWKCGHCKVLIKRKVIFSNFEEFPVLISSDKDFSCFSHIRETHASEYRGLIFKELVLNPCPPELFFIVPLSFVFTSNNLVTKLTSVVMLAFKHDEYKP